jgi:hypothetical protein
MSSRHTAGQGITFDYSMYERKLRAITSVKLENLTDLREPVTNEPEIIRSYFKKIANLLDTSEEV